MIHQSTQDPWNVWKEQISYPLQHRSGNRLYQMRSCSLSRCMAPFRMRHPAKHLIFDLCDPYRKRYPIPRSSKSVDELLFHTVLIQRRIRLLHLCEKQVPRVSFLLIKIAPVLNMGSIVSPNQIPCVFDFSTKSQESGRVDSWLHDLPPWPRCRDTLRPYQKVEGGSDPNMASA